VSAITAAASDLSRRHRSLGNKLWADMFDLEVQKIFTQKKDLEEKTELLVRLRSGLSPYGRRELEESVDQALRVIQEKEETIKDLGLENRKIIEENKRLTAIILNGVSQKLVVGKLSVSVLAEAAKLTLCDKAVHDVEGDNKKLAQENKDLTEKMSRLSDQFLSKEMRVIGDFLETYPTVGGIEFVSSKAIRVIKQKEREG
jgi:hypothetical protein